MHAAIYDAVNAIDRSHAPYAVRLSDVPRKASQEAAAATAAHDVLAALYPKFQATLDAQLQQSLAAIQDGTRKQEGITVGTEVARRILAIRSTDGSNASLIPFVPINAPGQYQLTPPNFPKPAFTHWSHVTPFTLRRASQFRPGQPPSLASDTFSDDFNEVKSLGIGNSTTRTADQTVVGRFWSGAIQNYWNEIAQTASQAHHLTTAQNARLFALLNLTAADSVIAFYDAKYTFRFWRPVTAIRAADTAGNPETVADPNWLPLTVNTAPDPSYPGAHSVISFASAFVLRSFFRNDHFTFNVTSEVLPGVQRSFTSFSAAATEAGLSRIFAGQHFRFDHVAGLHLGESVADFVTDNFLRRHESEDERGDR
jgi:membrane-associated phospholipid phosphatase